MVRLRSICLTQDKFTNSVSVFVYAHCSRPTAARLALRGTRRFRKSFNAVLFQNFVGNSFVNLFAPQPLNKYKFLVKIRSSLLKPILFITFCCCHLLMVLKEFQFYRQSMCNWSESVSAKNLPYPAYFDEVMPIFVKSPVFWNTV